MGYFLVKYDSLKDFLKVANDAAMSVYVDKQNTMFTKIWFVVSSENLVSAHEYVGKPEEINSAVREVSLRLFEAEYEYVK